MNEIQSYLGEMSMSMGIGAGLSKVLVALVIFFIGWIIARFVSKAVGKLLSKTAWDKKVEEKTSLVPSVFLKKIVYYFLMLFVLLAVLGQLGINAVLEPVENLLNSFLLAFPNLLYAIVVGVFGYFIAKIVSELVALLATSIEKLAVKMGLKEPSSLVNLLKKVVFIIIFVPILIQAIDLLNLEVISSPAKSLLATFIATIPNIVAAVIIIGLFFFIGRYLTGLLKEVLTSLGADSFVEKLGLKNVFGSQKVSSLIANIVFFFIMFIGIITGVEKLELQNLSEVLRNLLDLSGSIMFGLVIMIFGNYLSTIVFKSLNNAKDSAFVANVARWAILGMFLAISLRAMGIANEIVYLAFGLTLGAVAVAFALMFGLGGREAAGKHVDYMLEKFRNKK